MFATLASADSASAAQARSGAAAALARCGGRTGRDNV
jgi:hypothetical protein